MCQLLVFIILHPTKLKDEPGLITPYSAWLRDGRIWWLGLDSLWGKRVQAGSGAHPVHHPMGTGGSFPGG